MAQMLMQIVPNSVDNIPIEEYTHKKEYSKAMETL